MFSLYRHSHTRLRECRGTYLSFISFFLPPKSKPTLNKYSRPVTGTDGYFDSFDCLVWTVITQSFVFHHEERKQICRCDYYRKQYFSLARELIVLIKQLWKLQSIYAYQWFSFKLKRSKACFIHHLHMPS